MIRKLISILVTAAILMSTSVALASNDDVAPYSSDYIDSYSILLTPDGNGEMTAKYAVFATGRMNKVGAYKLTLEEEWGTDKWATSEVIYGDDDPDSFYGENVYDHAGNYTFKNLTPGVRYRVILTAYAGDRTGSDQKTLTSTAKTCK